MGGHGCPHLCHQMSKREQQLLQQWHWLTPFPPYQEAALLAVPPGDAKLIQALFRLSGHALAFMATSGMIL